MRDNLIGADDLLSTFAQQRQVLLKHTADVLCSDPQPVRHENEIQHAKLSAILVSSLEELKVAEEELVERTEALADLRDELEQRVRGARALFELAPTCLIVTDLYGTILELNREASALFKRDLGQLERQPLARFIAVDERRGFRDGLTRIAETNGVTDWRFELVRPTDAPLSVSAAVRVVKTPGAQSGAQLFWSIRVVGPAGPGTIA